MVTLRFEVGGYLVADTQEWLDDRSSELPEAQSAFDAYCQDHAHDDPRDYFPGTHAYRMTTGLLLLGWLRTLEASGLYGGGEPFQIATCNMESYLDDDVNLVLAHTDQYGSLLCVQLTDSYGNIDYPIKIRSFDSIEDADVLPEGGYANCTYCGSRAELLLEGVSVIWSNGGRYGSRYVSQLEVDEDDYSDDYYGQPYCPICSAGHLKFYSN